MRHSNWAGSVWEEFVEEVVEAEGVVHFVDRWKGLLRGWLVQTGVVEWFESPQCSEKGVACYWMEQGEGVEGAGVVLV